MNKSGFLGKSVWLIVGGVIAVVAAGLSYMLFFQRELDSNAQNGPLESRIVPIDRTIPIPEEIGLAAGFAYDADTNQFFVSSDEPHSLIPVHEAFVYVLNDKLDSVETQVALQTDGDLEGITCIGDNTIVVASEVGTLIYLEVDGNNQLTEQKRVSIFNSDEEHQLGSLAYDSQNKHLYTAEKEGEKIIYELDSDGNLLDSFILELPDSTQSDTLADDYTIAGMTYADGYLYIFSEAYSTIFKLNVETRAIEEVIGIDLLLETSGITVKNNEFYFIGDFETYLPTPQIYIVSGVH